MTTKLAAAALFGFALLLGASPAFAQFETPNRSFHNATAFKLEGRHQAVPCQACHLNGQYAGTPRTCYECHWIRRKDDRFQTRLGTECEQCHRPTSWTAVVWDHGAMTGMALNTDHRLLGCESCHKSGDVRAGSVTCVSCHRKDYDATTQPAHGPAGFPTACEGCHRPSDPVWQSLGGGGFSHAAVFPLVGVHATLACQSCHKNNVYRGTPRDCAGCHQADYNKTQNPNHAAAGFPTTCDACHRATDAQWSSGAGFNHSQFFPLAGVHATQACAACHKNNVFKGTPRDCVGCHQADYNRTTAPNHAAAGFPTACDTCHKPTDPQWSTATFNHSQFFPLQGVHATQACEACHKNGVYKGTPRDCAGCHLADYNRTTNPNHAAAGFPTTCDTCHRATDGSWTQGQFTHTWFPLTSRHNVPCSSCHTTPNNFVVFSCTVCHDRQTTNSHHQGVSGYVYDSQACYSCHPNGRAG